MQHSHVDITMVMSPRERKAELIRKGFTVTQIAQLAGVTQPHASHVLKGRHRSARVEQIIANAIGKPISRVFGKPQQRVA